jgi:hypothetical protein
MHVRVPSDLRHPLCIDAQYYPHPLPQAPPEPSAALATAALAPAALAAAALATAAAAALAPAALAAHAAAAGAAHGRGERV